MKNTAIASLIFIGAAAASQFAHASDGTMTFNGLVTSQTCTINGNGSNSNNFTVTLPTVSTSALAAAGQTAGRTPFSIALTSCPTSFNSVTANFQQGPTTDMSTGNLILNTGGASNVQLGLLNADFSNIMAGAAGATQNSKPVTIAANGSATLNYFVQYVATGAATAGAANSSVTYTMTYQ